MKAADQAEQPAALVMAPQSADRGQRHRLTGPAQFRDLAQLPLPQAHPQRVILRARDRARRASRTGSATPGSRAVPTMAPARPPRPAARPARRGPGQNGALRARVSTAKLASASNSATGMGNDLAGHPGQREGRCFRQCRDRVLGTCQPDLAADGQARRPRYRQPPAPPGTTVRPDSGAAVRVRGQHTAPQQVIQRLAAPPAGHRRTRPDRSPSPAWRSVAAPARRWRVYSSRGCRKPDSQRTVRRQHRSGHPHGGTPSPPPACRSPANTTASSAPTSYWADIDHHRRAVR